jgi:hypothetical protein
MKKVLFVLLGIGITMGAIAQTKVISKRPEEKEIKSDIKVKRAHKKAAVKNLSQTEDQTGRQRTGRS